MSKAIVVAAVPISTFSNLFVLLRSSINLSWESAASVSSSALTDWMLGLAINLPLNFPLLLLFHHYLVMSLMLVDIVAVIYWHLQKHL